MSQSPMRQIAELTEQIVAVVNEWESPGIMEVLDAYKQWPEVLHRLEAAWGEMHKRAEAGYPLHPIVVELLEGVARHQQLTAQHAEAIAPTAQALHRREIEALNDPRNAMWDHRANRDHAGPPASGNGRRFVPVAPKREGGN